jgi:mRNA-degrading endonuclease RelE of RelBE toxin-antitoxin system
VTYRVEVTPEFERDLERLDPKAARRVLDKVE